MPDNISHLEQASIRQDVSSAVRIKVFDPEQRCWLNFSEPVEIYQASTLTDVVKELKRLEYDCKQNETWGVGWISYEAAPAFDHSLPTKESSDLPYIWFATFRAPAISCEISSEINGKIQNSQALTQLDWVASLTPDEYEQALTKIRSAIAAGKTYQTNFSFRLTTSATPDPNSLLNSMYRNQGGDYTFLIETPNYTVVSASPELFFHKNGSTIVTRPMKGTRPRGLTPQLDQEISEQLCSAPKDRAENIMIVDMMRNDLSRIAKRGSVQVSSCYDVERYPHILQMTSEVRAETDASLVEILQALFPAASITGAPKGETMRIIAQLESTPRKIYTGALGVIAPNQRSWFNVAIRTALIDRKRGTTEYGVGSGIVWDSTSANEFQECLSKASAVAREAEAFDLFETMLWEPKLGLFLKDLHIQRLSEWAHFLKWPLNPQVLTETLKRVEDDLKVATAAQRVKVLLSRRGVISTQIGPLLPLPVPYFLSLAKDPISSTEPALYRKSTDRRIYDAAIPQVSEAHDAILWNEREEITESKIANIGLEIDGVVCTPRIESGLLNGCYRQHLLSTNQIVERTLKIADISKASKVLLFNSLRRSWEARYLD